MTEKNKQDKLELEKRLQDENAELKAQFDAEIVNRENEISLRIEAYVTEHRYRLQELEQQNERLRREHQTTVEILREENESIREQLDEKTFLIDDLKELRFRNEKLKKEFSEKEKCLEEKLIAAEDEIAVLKEENKKILETFKSDTKDNKLQVRIIEIVFKLARLYLFLIIRNCLLCLYYYFAYSHLFIYYFVRDTCYVRMAAQTSVVFYLRLHWDDVLNSRMKWNHSGQSWT